MPYFAFKVEKLIDATKSASNISKAERLCKATKIANKLSGTVWLPIRLFSHTQNTSSINGFTQLYSLTDLTASLKDLTDSLAAITQPCFLTYWKLVLRVVTAATARSEMW